MIKDSYNRVHNYLRISLTDNCNLRCSYCMPEEDYDFTPASRLMQADEIETLAKIFVDEGVTKIRLTGGEPLVRKDVDHIIRRLSKLPASLTLTTNGTRLDKYMDTLKAAGIKSVNVSLDSLQKEKFNLITQRDQFDIVWNNILLLIDNNFHVKVNVVVMKGINDREIPAFVQWTRKLPVNVRFIEFMPFTGNRWRSDKVVTLQEILQIISNQFEFIPVQSEKGETAKKFIVPGHLGTFAVISTMSAHFCGDCNRMRLTADGKMKNCLFSESEVDLLTPLRNGEDIRPLIHECISRKAQQLGGQFSNDFENVQVSNIHNRSMITIGG